MSTKSLEKKIIDTLGEFTKDKDPHQYYEAVTDLMWQQIKNPKLLPYS
jgi:hypothetical protein